MPERHEANRRVEDYIVRRWSPRSFDASEMPMEDLEAIFEAAGWAPSSYNIQPWRFLYARRGDANWDRFLSLLIDSNKAWAKDASVLIFIVSDRMNRLGDEPQPNRPHTFDAGAAWAMMALQATAMGYHAHGMIGVHLDEAEKELRIPADHSLEAAVAIGRQAPKERLPERLQQREFASGRKPVSDIAFAGSLPVTS
jgi:nitroreductase